VPVHIKVIDRSMPVFDKQFYTDTVSEDIEVHSPLALNIQAESPMGRKLIYSIEKGNDFEEFALDFNTGECLFYKIILTLLLMRVSGKNNLISNQSLIYKFIKQFDY